MNNYGLTGARPSIDMSEVASVKEMIFNRAKEKSSSLATEREEGMTQAVQNDVMASARASISGSRKPFGNLTQNIKTETEQNFLNTQAAIRMVNKTHSKIV